VDRGLKPTATIGSSLRDVCKALAANEPSTARSRAGYTLLEVILALAILAGAVAVLGEISRLALQNAASARDLARAQLLAESKMSEIMAGIIAPDTTENTPFDTSSESLDPAEPGWLYSIASEATDEDGLISVKVTVTRDAPAAMHPTKFSLVRRMKDPNYTYTPPPSENGATSTSSTSSGTGGS